MRFIKKLNDIRKRYPWIFILIVYLVHMFVVISSTYFGQNLLAGKEAPLEPADTIIKGLTQWDGVWFIKIVTEGYGVRSSAFLPMYPLLIYLLQGTGIPPQIGALLISNISFFLILLIFYRMVILDYSESVSEKSLWYLALFPTAFYFSASYTESLYLLMVLLTLYLGRTKHWFLAALCCMFASLTRNLGILLIVPLLYEYWKQENQNFSSFSIRAHKKLLWLLLIPAGLGIYMLYLWQDLGTPLAFIYAQKFWWRSFDYPWNSIYFGLLKITTGDDLLNLAFTLYAVGFLALSVKLLRPSYTLYMFFGLFAPLSSRPPYSPLISMPRYVLVLFPIYIAMALLIKNEQTHRAFLIISTVLLIFLNIRFTNSIWVA